MQRMGDILKRPNLVIGRHEGDRFPVVKIDLQPNNRGHLPQTKKLSTQQDTRSTQKDK